jgi:DNA mismatch repair protein MSH4
MLYFRPAADQSLVIIDELGRATSNADGVGIAWAVAESLSRVGAYTRACRALALH